MRGSTMLAWCVLLGLVAAVAGHGGMIENGFSDGDFQAYWEIYKEGDKADFMVSAPADGWVAIGFGGVSGMEGDFIVGYLSGADVVVNDFWYLNGTFVEDVMLNGTKDVENANVTQSDDRITMTFTRVLDTGDHYDWDLNSEGNLVVKWAYGKLNGKAIGNITASGEKEMSFYGDKYGQLRTHGILMVFVVMVLMVAGLIMSRYMKTIFYYWFYVHAAVFVLSLVFIISSTVIIFQAHHNEFEPSWHSAFGLMFIISMGLQSLIGLLSHLMFDKKRLGPPLFPDKIHWWFGRISFFVGMLTVYLGLNAFPASRLAFNGYYLWLILIFFLVLALERYVGQTHEVIAKGIDEDDDAFDTREEGDEEYVPRRRSLTRGGTPKQVPMTILSRILGVATFSILLLFIVVAIGINTSEGDDDD